MELGYIQPSGLEYFEALLLPEVGTLLKAGKPVTALGLTEDGVACGAIALWASGGRMAVRSLYVAPEYRRRGGGRMLVEAAVKLAEGQCDELTADFEMCQEDHDTLPPFLTALGFRRDHRQNQVHSLTLGSMAALPFFADQRGSTLAVPFSKIPEFALKTAYQESVVRSENFMERSDFLTGLDQELSMAIMAGDKLASFVAIRQVAPDWIELSWASSSNPRHMVSLLRGAFAAAMKKLGPKALVTIQAVTPASMALLEKLLPNADELTQSWVRPLY